jgi:hypothetical protein
MPAPQRDLMHLDATRHLQRPLGLQHPKAALDVGLSV